MNHITVAEAQRFIELEVTMVRTQEAFFEFCAALLEIRDQRLYRANYPTFEEYCQRRWGMGRQRAYQLIDATQVIKNLSTMVDIPMPTNERQARALASLTPEQQREAWAAAVESSPNGKPTAADVKRTANGYRPKLDRQRGQSTADSDASGKDECQTPPYALNPLLPYMPAGATIWEPAAGDGYLVRAIEDQGYSVVSGDIKTGQDFFAYEPPAWDILLTNPPYSSDNKYKWLKRCYELGKPFALLLPADTSTLGEIQPLFRQYGVEIVFMDKRVDFQTINTPFAKSNAWFPTAWFACRLIGQPLTFAEINKKRLS